MTRDRRRAPRRSPGAADPLSRARLRTGTELRVIEISDLGALVRTSARLLPGTHVDVHLMTVGGRVLRRARVARAAVWRLDADGIAYQVALAFDAAVDSSARWVGATPEHDDPSRVPGEPLPLRPWSGEAVPADSRQDEKARRHEVASDLVMGAGHTFAKESRDVVQQ